MKRSLSILLTVAMLLTNCFAFTALAAEEIVVEDLEVIATGFISDNVQVYTLEEGSFTAVANVKNYNAVDVNATVFFYLYNADGILEDVKMTSQTITAQTNVDVYSSAMTVAAPENSTLDGYSLNVIVVADADNIAPLGAVKTITTETERGNFKDTFDIPMYTASTEANMGKWVVSKHKAVQRSNGVHQDHYIEGSGDGSANVLTSLTYEGDFGGKALALEVCMNDSKEMAVKEYMDAYAPVMQVTTDGTSWSNVYPEYVDYSNEWIYLGWNGYVGRIAKFIVPELSADVTGVKVGFTGNYRKKLLSVEIADEISTSGMYSVDEIESGIILYDDFSSITAADGTGAHAATGSKFTRSGDNGWGWVYRTGTFTAHNSSYSPYFEGWGNDWHPAGYFSYDGSFGGNKLEIVTGMSLEHGVDGLEGGHVTTDLASYVENYALAVSVNDVDVTADLTAEIIDTFDNGYVVKYTLAEIPEGATNITLRPTGNWQHKLFSVGVYDPVVSAQGTDFVDTFATVTGVNAYNTVTSTDVKYYSSSTNFFCQSTGTIQGPADNNADASIVYEGKFGNGTLKVDVGVGEGHFTGTVVPANGNTWSGAWGDEASEELFKWLPGNFEIYAGPSAAALEALDYEYAASKGIAGVIGAQVQTTLPENAKVIKLVWKNARYYTNIMEVSVSGAQGGTGSEEPVPTEAPVVTAEPVVTPAPALLTSFVDTFDTVEVAGSNTAVTSTDTTALYAIENLFCAEAGDLQGQADWQADSSLVYNGEFSKGTLSVSLGVADWYFSDVILPELGTNINEAGWDSENLKPWLAEKLEIYAGPTYDAMTEVAYNIDNATSANKGGNVGLKVTTALPEGTKFVKVVYKSVSWVGRFYEVSVTGGEVYIPEATPVPGTNFVDPFDTVAVTDAYTTVTATDVNEFYSATNLYCVSEGMLQGQADWDADGTLIYNGEFSNGTVNVKLGVADFYYVTVVGNEDYDPAQLYSKWVEPRLTIYAGASDTSMKKLATEYAGSANSQGQVGVSVNATLPEGTKFIKIVYSGIRWQSKIYEVSVKNAEVSTLTSLFDNFSTIDGEAQGTNFLSTSTVGAQYSYVSNLVYRTDRDPLPSKYQGENAGVIEGSWGGAGGFGIGYDGNFEGRAMRISLAYNEDTYKEAFYAIRGEGATLVWNDYAALYEYYIKNHLHFNYGTAHGATTADAGIYKYDGEGVSGFVIINVYSNQFPESSYVEAIYDHQEGKDAFYWKQRLISVLIDEARTVNGDSYIDPDASIEDLIYQIDPSNYTENMVSVIAPVYTSDISGETTFLLCAPELDNVKVYAWNGNTNVLLANLDTYDNGGAGFRYDAANLEYGPNNIKLYGYKNGHLEDICELIVYNTSSSASKETIGLENANALPAAVQALGLTEQYADDFEQGNLSFSAPNRDASGYDYYGPISSRLFSDWATAPFTNDGRPFSMTGDYLRIRATVDADGEHGNTTGSTGFIASLNEETHKGFAIKAPAYFECKFIAQDTQGSWPSFWLLNTQYGAEANHGLELDVIEAYGSQPTNDGKYTTESNTYSATSHDWGNTVGNYHPSEHTWVDMPKVGDGSNWSQSEHAYGVLVTETETVYYLDGIEVLRHDNFEGASEYLWFMINYAFGSGWTCDATRYNDTSDMYVDWVRVYGLDQNVMPN